MSERKLRRAVRWERKRRRLGRRPSCGACSEDDIRVLQLSGGKTLCASCRLAAQGKPPYERHHPAGRRNDPFTVKRTANEHRVFSDMQEEWPSKTLRNPHRSILRSQAAWLRGSQDQLARAAEVFLDHARALEEVDDFLGFAVGDQWPKDFDNWRKGRRDA